MSTQKRIKSKKSENKKSFEDLLDVCHHPDKKVCAIVATSLDKKKNVFASFRPQPGTCLDYQISQTDTKMDAGPVKIHIQEIKGTYDLFNPEDMPPSSKPKRRKNQWFSGGPPVWEFVDEKWRREQEARQEGFRERLAKAEKHSKDAASKGNRTGHYQLLQLVGPDWYQELSPNQVRTVDDFKNSIMKDLRDGTIVNTQKNLAKLGLVLRPNPKLVGFALRQCCACPVEFLLILYQLTNPNRDEYSINDRLLLSGVVHLTMEATLKELHIRIPSPPRRPEAPKLSPKPKKRLIFKSPYLEPYSFEPEPRKFSGIYFDKHLQLPESSYFGYVEKLKQTIRNNEGFSEVEPVDDVDGEILQEVQVAQEIYSNVGFQPVPNLLKPSIYVPCGNFRNKKGLKNETKLDENSNNLLEVPGIQMSLDNGDVAELHQPMLPTIREATCINTCSSSESPEEKKSFQETRNCCRCKQSTTKGLCKSQGVCRPPTKRLTIDSSNVACLPNNKEPRGSNTMKTSRETNASRTLGDSSEISFGEKFKERKVLPLEKSRGTKIGESECRCKTEARKTIETKLCPCPQCEQDRRKKSSCYVISGLKKLDSETTVPIIEGVLSTERDCSCLEKFLKRLSEDPCKLEAQRVIAEPLCPCERCGEERNKRNINYVISGIKEIGNEAVSIIDGVTFKQPCLCLRQYLSKLEQFESYKMRTAAVNKLKQEEKKFVIGGVVNRPEGPVYILSGICPQQECKCSETARKEIEEQERLSRMPQVPAGRVKYGISGVKETLEGNVFVLSQALPIEDCDCMKLYKKYETRHSTCMQLYEDYLAQMKCHVNEYLDDWLPNDEKEISMTSCEEKRSERAKSLTALGTTEFVVTEPLNEESCEGSEQSLNKCGNCESETSLKEVDGGKCQTGSVRDDVMISSNSMKNYPKMCESDVRKDGGSGRVRTKRILTSTACSCGGKPKLSQSCNCGTKKNFGRDQCLREVVPSCTCGVEKVGEKDTIEKEELVEVEEPKLKRIIISNKFSCNLHKQMKILKQALRVMAEDGYPLAKLPDSYLLPHFKLWMQMRCGKSWTQAQKASYIPKSRALWRHSDRCVRRVKMANLKISPDKAGSLTWFDAKYCRKIVGDALNAYYRQCRQVNIDFGREFFPTTFSYEFPFKTFRDCYFAYTPSKEEDVLAAFMWERFDVKDFSKRKSCFC